MSPRSEGSKPVGSTFQSNPDMRSQHAERMALLSVAASAASQNQVSRPDLQETRFSTWPCHFLHGRGQDRKHSTAGLYMCEQERAADRQSTAFGAVRLYATHTLCISCLAVCCQFHRRLVRFNRWCIERAGSFAVVR